MSSGVGHEFDDFQHLRPARFVVVAHAEGSRNRKSAGPDSPKPGLLDDTSAQSIVSLHQEFKTLGLQEPLELLCLADFASGRRSHDAQQPTAEIIDFLATQYQ